MTYYLATISAFFALLLAKYPDMYIGTRPRKDLPGPKGIPIFGNLLQIIPNIKRMIFWMDTVGALHGPLYTFTMPSWGRCIVVNHPSWLEHIRKNDTMVYTKGMATLAIFKEFPGPMSPFATDGTSWRSCRKLISPIFSVKNFNIQVSTAMNEIIPIAVDMLLSAADEGVQFDWNNFSGRVAISVLYRMAFGLDPETINPDYRCLNEPDALVAAMHECNTTSSGRLYNPIWKITDKFCGTQRRFNNARSVLYETAGSVLRKRRAQLSSETKDGGQTALGTDFLSAMIDSGLSDSEICGTIVTIFFAGHDNFLNVLGWSLYELSRESNWLARMRDEAFEQTVSDSVLKYGDISRYPVHLAVFYETLRLWPGVPKNARYAEEDDVLPAVPEIGIAAVKVNRGDYVLWSDRYMMRSEIVWGHDAKKFNPGRFLDEAGQFIKPPAPKFHAFGSGPRLCPGAQLATYEFVAIWAAILPHLDIVPLDNSERTMKDSFTSTMNGEFLVEARRLVK
ncbi:hypothetical protein A7U60_g3500 [Sanghuangporus baumii]|uniref:Cytochrome P450 n=1 Tax=Sanghuangporus baumii TaxID=108892 RepID=A0A9Q5I0I0_SANBA|nr:hypothetical protein A7U60_g3500 [Sanghuangporus baumii]